MKILIIGDCTHHLLTSLLNSLKNKLDIRIHGFSIKPKNKKPELFECFTYALYDKSSNAGKFSYVRNLIKNFKRTDAHYDIIHIHLNKVQYLFIWYLIKKRSSRVIISIWGSEFLRAGKIQKFLLGIMYKRADIIHCTNSALKKTLIESFNIPQNKVIPIPFILENLKHIDELKIDKEICKKDLNWDESKLQVVIGYNFNEGQQHLDIIESCSKLPENILDQIQFIFPLTYGTHHDYKDLVIKTASNKLKHIDYYEDFLDDMTIAKMRVAGDVFINLQITDQYSATMVESLFAQNIVITGDWLPYENLRRSGAYYLTVNKIDKLGDLLENVFENMPSYLEKSNVNKKAMKALFDESKIIKSWERLYFDLT